MKTDRRLSNAKQLLLELSQKELEGTPDFSEVLMVSLLSILEDIHYQLVLMNRNINTNTGVPHGTKNI